MEEPIKTLASLINQQASIAGSEMAAKPADNMHSWAAISPATRAPLAAAMRSIPTLATLEGRFCVFPSGGTLIDFDAASVYLLHRAQHVSPETIAADLIRLGNERSVTLTEVRLIIGLRPTLKVDLGHGFSVVPPEITPTYDDATQLFSDSNRPKHGFGSPPTGAICRRRKYDLVLNDPPTTSMMLSTSGNERTSDRDWQAALDACALASDAAPAFRQEYAVVEDPGWLGMRSNGLGSSESFPVPERHATFFDEDKAALLFSHLRDTNSTIQLAVRSLISSRRRLTPEEQALDLGTCVEVLLMSGSKDNAEISYKIRTRAAWLIGNDADERLEVFRAAGHLYDDRSKATHTGSLGSPKNMKEMEAQRDRLRRSDRLCVQLISTVLEQGVPDGNHWHSIVLSVPRSAG